MPPAKMERMFINFKNFAVTEIAIFANSVFAWAAAYFSEMLTALPILISLIFQIYIRLKRESQHARHREEIHRETMRLLGEGRIKPGEALLDEKD